MKAVLYESYGSPDVIRLKDIAKPIPGDNEILIKIYASVVTQADCAMRRADTFMVRLFEGLTKPKHIPGDMLAGEVEAVGSAVTRFKVGDRVCGSTGPDASAHTEYRAMPDNAALVPIPDGMDYADAVAVHDGALTALPFLRDKGKIKKDQAVLINGASGAVGTAAVQLAKHFGVNVTGVCGPSNIDLVKSLGADTVIDYTKEDFTRTKAVYDIIFDTVGKSSFSRAKYSLKPGGIYLTTVLKLSILWQMLRTATIGDKKAIITFAGLRSAADKSKDMQFLNDLAVAGKIKPVIDKTYPLERVAEAHRYVDARHKKGNVILTMNHHK